MKVVGALGPSLHAPLLAEEDGRRWVLHRPSPDALAGVHGTGIAVGERTFALDGRELAIYPWIPGMDVGRLLDAHEPLPGFVVRYLVDGVRGRLEEAPIPHGALRSSQVRVEAGGPVWLVGFRGGGEDAVDELVDEWGTPGDPDPLAAESWLRDHVDPHPELFEHPWTGRELVPSTGAEQGQVPVQVRTAAVAGVTLVLGLLSGALVGNSLYAPRASEVVVDGASSIRAQCGDVELRTDASRLILPDGARTCSIEAVFSPSVSVEADLRVTLPGSYRCAQTEGALRCTAR